MTELAHLSRTDFDDRLGTADAVRRARSGRWAPLEGVERAVVYTYGVKGRDLALQLRARGVDCLIFDNSEVSRRRAVADGFELAQGIDGPEPLLIGAGQNQIEIMDELEREAFSLAETLYAMDLRNSYGPARRFTDEVLGHLADYHALYSRMDADSAAMFLQVLEYRASLDVRVLTLRRPVGEMWRPPIAGLQIRSFCDVGAYDGDSLRATKAVYPALTRSFTIEPNPNLADPVARTADELGIDNSHFVGVAWSADTQVRGHAFFNGMFAIEEDAQGDIPAKSIDALVKDEAFDFVKMDVEGTERQVIAGARQALARATCVAIAAYHLPDDLRALPQVMEAGEGTWNLAFNHYSQTFDDSIFYLWR